MPQYEDDADLSSLAAIGAGGNIASSEGSPESTLSAAFDLLCRESARICAVSRYFRTEAWPPGSGPGFVNAAVLLRTPLAPHDLLARLHEVEARFGRRRDARWGPRTLDLDLLFHGDRVLPDRATQARWRDLPPDRQAVEAPGEMILPHPRLQDRPFVLIPLAEIAPGWRHPATGRTVAEMAAALDPAQKAAVRPFPG